MYKGIADGVQAVRLAQHDIVIQHGVDDRLDLFHAHRALQLLAIELERIGCEQALGLACFGTGDAGKNRFRQPAQAFEPAQLLTRQGIAQGGGDDGEDLIRLEMGLLLQRNQLLAQGAQHFFRALPQRLEGLPGNLRGGHARSQSPCACLLQQVFDVIPPQ